MTSLLQWLRGSNSLWGRALLGIIGGLAIATSFPTFSFWPGMFLGIFLILLGIRQLGFFKSFIVGFLSGFAMFAFVLKWLTTYLGPIPWVALSIMQALLFAVGIGVMSVVWRWLSSLTLGKAKPFIIAVTLGGIYTGREFVTANFPFDGFPWARGGISQLESVLARWVYAIDIAGLTWLIVSLTALVAIKFVSPLPQGSGIYLRSRSWLPAITTSALVFAIPAVMVLDSSATAGTLKVAAVQGNANAGLFAVNPPGSILDKHLDVSRELLRSGKADGVELMVWPENSADLDPVTMVEPSLKITKFVDTELKAPLLFGNKTFRGSDFFNEVDLWLPEVGLNDWYDKKRPVPFGEYVPYRPFFMALAPDLVGLIGWDMSAGTRDGIFEVPNKTKVGSLICFEVTIDGLSYDLVDGGATAIMIQTNSSDFGRSEQGVQLAAISRMRAIQTGRTVVSISTVGVSGIYSPDGKIIEELETFTPGAMVSDISLRNDVTPAVMFGRYIEPGAFIFSSILFPVSIIGLIINRRKRKRS